MQIESSLSLASVQVMPWIVAVILLTIRVGVAFGMSPVLSAYGIPLPVRMGLVVVIATLACAQLYTTAVPALPLESADLLTPLLAEVFAGFLLGISLHVILAAFAIAGRLLDIQIGFGIGSVFDPVTRVNSNVVGSLMSLLGVSLFFMTDAHLEMAHLLCVSTNAFPIGQMPVLADPMALLNAAGVMFRLGFALVSSVVFALLLTDIVIGIASRNLPQVNVLMLSIPLKVIVGYACLSVVVSGWSPLVRNGFTMTSNFLGVRL